MLPRPAASDVGISVHDAAPLTSRGLAPLDAEGPGQPARCGATLIGARLRRVFWAGRPAQRLAMPPRTGAPSPDAVERWG